MKSLFRGRPEQPRSEGDARTRNRHTASMIDPQTLMRIKSLQARARVVVEGFVTGIHRSPYFGFSVEFSEYRQYSSGDDTRYIDWRLFARSDRYFIKRFEDETNLRCTIVLDTSRSMSYGSGAYSKIEYARTMAATLAYFLTTQRDAVGLITFEDRVIDVLPPRHRPGHLRRMLSILERPPEGRNTDLIRPLEEVALTVRKRGLLVIISDFLAPIDALRSRLGYLKSRGHDVVVFRTIDPVEFSFDFQTPAMFFDVESERDLYIDPALAREEYKKQFSEHSRGLEQACADFGIPFSLVSIDQPLELVLFDFLKSRSTPLGRRTLVRRSNH